MRNIFHVKGLPAPKGSFVPTKNGKYGVRHASKYLKAWTDAVVFEARKHTKIEAADGYDVVLHFYFERPKKPSKSYPSKVDLDKLVRSTLDALVTAGLISDDRHVAELYATKNFSGDLKLYPQGCEIVISEAAC